jgi:hypothetical protein
MIARGCAVSAKNHLQSSDVLGPRAASRPQRAVRRAVFLKLLPVYVRAARSLRAGRPRSQTIT